ncbi:cytochrome c oxidase accessory protein CcoG [Polaromonas hydrogenivorans]|uniref:Cytochrome c oxidase accessory protein CcoG n=1 Tax=Polaromonas hydrogenivorans TaxID=335476 RepID=A0AAU7LMP9_9BURK
MNPSRKVIPIAVASSGAAAASLFAYEAPNKIYARAVSGWFAAWRWAMVWITQLVFYGLPWLQWNGRQAVLFDLEGQRFFLFGLALYPQDLIYLTALLIVSALALFLFTAVAGRLWCGFACPQTVYTEIFMWVERKTEGDRIARMRLDAAPWSVQKLARKAAKQTLWVAISLWTGFTFVGYFTPILTLAASTAVWSAGPWEVFWVLFYGTFTYGNAGYLREQVCKHMCPYARFQGAMFDRDTLIIGYDKARGESRGSRPRSADAKALGLGDCIDCTLCVQVCPTGIDIRNGLQSNCIGCAACIDVCDSVMDKMNYPRGLIRYSTENALAHGWSRAELRQHIVRPRVLVYGALLLVVAGVLVASISLRSPFRVNVIRDRGVMARTVANGVAENVYRLQVMNATETAQRYRVDIQGPHGMALAQPVDIELQPIEERYVPVTVRLPGAAAMALAGQKLPLRFEVRQLADSGTAAEVLEDSTFWVPR